MTEAISETTRRRNIQEEYNEKQGITPKSIEKKVSDILSTIYDADYFTVPTTEESDINILDIPPDKISGMVQNLTKEMKEAAKKLEFERAAQVRDKIKRLRELELKYLEGVK
jgi:excinuclease ABC subunit B